jgi:predicted aspartyl protease
MSLLKTAPIEVVSDSIAIHATVNGQPVTFVLDTGDAIGPVFTAADAARLHLVQGAPLGVEGAGGASTACQATATIEFDNVTFPDEPSAIDTQLQGQSLLGLPFFLAKAAAFGFDLADGQLFLLAK